MYTTFDISSSYSRCIHYTAFARTKEKEFKIEVDAAKDGSAAEEPFIEQHLECLHYAITDNPQALCACVCVGARGGGLLTWGCFTHIGHYIFF